MKAMYKSELARAAGVSVRTLANYIQEVLNTEEFKKYNKKCHLLDPAQVKLLCRKFCIDI